MKETIFLLLLSFSSLLASATHLRGGHISVDKINQVSRKCQITVTVYTDSGCIDCVFFGGELSILDFGDGTKMTVPETPNTPVPGFPGVGYANFIVDHVFPGNSNYVISFTEHNRNYGVVNMDESGVTPFYIETSFDLSVGFLATPSFLTPPVYYAPIGSQLTISAGVVSEEDYIPFYRFRAPKKERGVSVDNYKLPESITINPYSGLITWDTKFIGQYQLGEFAFTVEVTLFKEDGESFIPVCSIAKDLQIILTDSNDALNVTSYVNLDDNGRIYIPVNEPKSVKIFFEKNFSGEVVLTAFSELESNDAVFSFTPYDSSSNPSIKVGVLTLNADASITRENPYLIVVRGQFGQFAKDFSLLFFTEDVQPKLVEYVDRITGLEDKQKPVDIYPNPSTDFFHFNFSENQPAAISIYDQAGKLVHASFSAGPISLDLRHLNPGLYLCTISSGASLKRVRLLKN